MCSVLCEVQILTVRLRVQPINQIEGMEGNIIEWLCVLVFVLAPFVVMIFMFVYVIHVLKQKTNDSQKQIKDLGKHNQDTQDTIDDLREHLKDISELLNKIDDK